jgi:ribonuclease HI
MGKPKKNNFWSIRGVETIFESWDECLKFKTGTSYVARGFVTKQDAIAHSIGTWNQAEDCTNIWTDGSTLNNGSTEGYGGYSVVYGENDVRNQAFQLKGTKVTNNICETMAIIAALKSIRENNIQGKVVIHSDSKYVLGYLNNKGSRSGYVENLALLKELDEMTKQFTDVEFRKVAAHAGNSGNDTADLMAKSAAKECKKRSLAEDKLRHLKKIKADFIIDD